MKLCLFIWRGDISGAWRRRRRRYEAGIQLGEAAGTSY
jgi:hypothetical protein